MARLQTAFYFLSNIFFVLAIFNLIAPYFGDESSTLSGEITEEFHGGKTFFAILVLERY